MTESGKQLSEAAKAVLNREINRTDNPPWYDHERAAITEIVTIVAEAAIAAYRSEHEAEVCEYTQGDYDLMLWTFACGKAYYFEHGNEPTYCPNCGKRIHIKQ